MKQFKIYRHPSGVTEAVKQGWSWPAFFFSFLWAFLKKQWVLGAAVLGGMFAFGFVLGLAGAGAGGDALIHLVSFIVNVMFGVNGNAWREKNLLSRGYQHVETVTAANPEGALALTLKGEHAGGARLA